MAMVLFPSRLTGSYGNSACSEMLDRLRARTTNPCGALSAHSEWPHGSVECLITENSIVQHALCWRSEHVSTQMLSQNSRFRFAFRGGPGLEAQVQLEVLDSGLKQLVLGLHQLRVQDLHPHSTAGTRTGAGISGPKLLTLDSTAEALQLGPGVRQGLLVLTDFCLKMGILPPRLLESSKALEGHTGKALPIPGEMLQKQH